MQGKFRELLGGRQQPYIWWMVPHRFLSFFVLPLAIFILLASDEVIKFNAAGYKSRNYITGYYVALLFSGLAVLCLFSFVSFRIARPVLRVHIKNAALDFLFICTVSAYLIWFVPLILSDPGVLLGTLTGQARAVYKVRALDLNISGVTTITQFGISFVCIYGAKRFLLLEELAPKYKYMLWSILALSIFRALVNSERIAFLELLFPLVLFRAASLRPYRLPGAYQIIRIFPIITIIGAPTFFAVFEYNRSWATKYQYYYDSIITFAVERLSIYYVSSLNNACGFLDLKPWPTYTGDWTFRWLYRFPGIGEILRGLFPDSQYEAFQEFLKQGADLQFNNTTGILVVYQDWGFMFGIMWFALYGVLAGASAAAFMKRNGLSMYYYPIIFYSLYELLRIGYLYDGRCMSAIIGLSVCYLVWGRVERRPIWKEQGTTGAGLGPSGSVPAGLRSRNRLV